MRERRISGLRLSQKLRRKLEVYILLAFGLQQANWTVAGVFSNVATSYDTMNDFMSLGIHRLWKYAPTPLLTAPTN